MDGRYQFEPERVVRRGDLAEIIAATLLLIAEIDPESGRRWRAARPRFTDLTSGHLNFDSASIAVGADILDLYENDRFLPIRVVSGRDAADVVTKLTDLLERVR